MQSSKKTVRLDPDVVQIVSKLQKIMPARMSRAGLVNYIIRTYERVRKGKTL